MNKFIKPTKQISIFITAGYPTLESTTEQIVYMQNEGVDFIEVGIPFSDPMADGPIIQETSSIALANGMQMDLLFDQLSSIQQEVKIPLVLMGYLNPVLQYGLEKFLEKCSQLNIASVILPDMSLELYERFYKTTFQEYGIPVSFLITPLTKDERIQKIAEICSSSFIYLVSKTSITGEKKQFDNELLSRYEVIKTLCGETPVMIGFGISSSVDIRKAHIHGDGAIIGSAYLKAVMSDKTKEFVDAVLG